MVELTEKERKYVGIHEFTHETDLPSCFPVEYEKQIEVEDGYIITPDYLKNYNDIKSESYIRNVFILQNISDPV